MRRGNEQSKCFPTDLCLVKHKASIRYVLGLLGVVQAERHLEVK